MGSTQRAMFSSFSSPVQPGALPLCVRAEVMSYSCMVRDMCSVSSLVGDGNCSASSPVAYARAPWSARRSFITGFSLSSVTVLDVVLLVKGIGGGRV